jgi:hypothetical protein
LNDAIAATVEKKYTRERLNQLKIDGLRKTYRAAIPHGDRKTERHTKAEYATREFMIDAILKSETHT